MIDSNKKLKRFYAAELSSVSEAVEPICPHFGVCGGCSMQSVKYEEQLQIKGRALSEIFEGLSELEGVSILAAPDPLNYRTRMDYVTSSDPIFPPLNRLGLRRKKKFNIVEDLSICHLISPDDFALVRLVFERALELEVEIYDLVKHTGNLRYLVVRASGESKLLSIVTHEDKLSKEIESLAEYAISLGFTSVHWLPQPTLTDTSFADSKRFWGAESLEIITNTFNPGTKFRIGPNNFFQSNLAMFEKLLGFVESNLPEESENWRLLDLYSGVGTIGILLADKFKEVVGVEVEAASVEMAKKNVELNSLSNLEYFTGDVPEFMKSTDLASKLKTMGIIDPPRTGMGKDGVEQILKLAPELLVYISCNPITQRLDLEGGLLEHYKVINSQGFDMFPQTLHMENVIVLSKR